MVPHRINLVGHLWFLYLLYVHKPNFWIDEICVIEFMVLILDKVFIKNMSLSKEDQIAVAENVNSFFSLCHFLNLEVLSTV